MIVPNNFYNMSFIKDVINWLREDLINWFRKVNQNCPQTFQLTRTPLHGADSVQIELNGVKLIQSEWLLHENDYVSLVIPPSPKDDVLVSVVYHHKGESCGAINKTWFRPNGN
jgi:hypothetical protein